MSKWTFQTCVPSLPYDGLDQTSIADGCPPGQKLFDKPWSTNWIMFLGEFWLFPVYKLQRYTSAQKRIKMGKLPRDKKFPSPFLFAIPAFCDMLGSGLGRIGMMFISAVVWQMMRGSIIIATSALTVCFLKKPLESYQYVAVSITVTGLSIIGYAACADEKATSEIAGSPSALLGIVLVLLAQIASAFQCVFEEHLLSGKQVSANLTVAMEGFWGMIFQGVLLIIFGYLPGSDHGRVESFPDTWNMWTSPESATLDWLGLGYMTSIAMYNLCGLKVTKSLSAVTRCLVDSVRGVLVWCISLLMFYNGDPMYGTPWTVHSYLQIVGFTFLVVGTLTYNAVITIPGLKYFDEEERPPGVMWSPPPQRKGLPESEFSPPVSPTLSPFESPLLNPQDTWGPPPRSGLHNIVSGIGIDEFDKK